MWTVAIANQKGGVGKTTTSVNLAAALGRMDRRVLVVDLDNQCHATEWLGVTVNTVTPEQSSYGVLSARTPITQTLRETEEDNVWLCPGHPFLAKAAKELGEQADGFFILQEALEELAADQGLAIDVVLFDCPPASGPVTFNALLASDCILAPVFVEALSLQGLKDLHETVVRIRRRLKPAIPDPVVLLNNYEGRAQVDRQIHDDLLAIYGERVLRTVIGRDAPLREAFIEQKSIFRHRRNARAANQFRELAEEITRGIHE